MGNACCVAARDKNIVSGPSSDILHRNIRHSPTWSFRWDNRGRVAGEETSLTWLSDANNRNQVPAVKYSSARASGDGSSLDSSQRCAWQKSPVCEGPAAFMRTPASDHSVSRNMSMDSSLEQVKESSESPMASDPSLMKLSLSSPSTSSVPVNSTAPSLPHPSSGHVSDSRAPEIKPSNSISVQEERSSVPSWSNDSTRGSHGGSSDGWSMHAFSELMASSHREKWSFDNDSLSFNHEKCKSSDRISTSPIDLQTCGVCSKLLTEKSLWSSQKLVMSNELSVVSVLICGHVYHAECLEILTPEICKYDPSCPVCTMGEKQTHKLSQKAFKAEMDLKAKNRKSKNRVVDSDLDVDSIVLDRMKGEGKGVKMGPSSSMKCSSSAKPFLKRHFSFGSKVSKSLGESNSAKKKGFFWTRSLKV